MQFVRLENKSTNRQNLNNIKFRNSLFKRKFYFDYFEIKFLEALSQDNFYIGNPNSVSQFHLSDSHMITMLHYGDRNNHKRWSDQVRVE